MKKVTVERKHKYTNEKITLYEGNSLIENKDGNFTIKYIDAEKYKVEITFVHEVNECILKRSGAELNSEMRFSINKKTNNRFKSNYGDFFIEIKTNDLNKNGNIITIDYDVVSSCDQDGYIIKFEVED